MTTPDATDSQLLGLYPQQTKNYLSIYQPSLALIGQVSGSYSRTNQTVSYDGVVSGSYSNVTADEFMVMLVGSAPMNEDYGRTWVRSATASQIRVVESDHINWQDNAYITILKYTEIIPVFPRIIQDPSNDENVIFYKWYDLAYTNQNSVLGCVPVAGSHYAGFGTRVYYSASGTSNILGNSMTYAWTFEGATSGSSTAHTPGYIDYPGPGHYRTLLNVTSSNGAVDKTIRYISLYNRPGEGPNQPYLDWTRSEFAGSIDGRGYTCRIKVRDPIPADTVLDGALVVIFKDDWYGDQQASVKNNGLGRSNISMVGYIEGGTIQYNYYDGSVEFQVVSPTKIMEICEGFSISVEDSASPTTWYQLLNMTVKRAIYHYMKWQSTIMLCNSVQMQFTDRDVQFFDADRTTLYDALYSFLNGTLYGNIVSDKLGTIWMFQDPAAVHDPTTNIPTALSITKTNWIGQPMITERQFNDVCYIEMGGILFVASTDASTALLGSAPGLSPAYHGRVDKKQGLALISQTELNNMVGDLYAYRNSRYPDVQLKMRSNYANLDIAPPEKLLLNVASDDTPRRVTWTDKPFVLTGISWERDEKQQIELPTVTLAELPSAYAGTTISIPVDPPTVSTPTGGGGYSQPPIYNPGIYTPPALAGAGAVEVYYNGTYIMTTNKLNFIGQIVYVKDNAGTADIMFDACGCSGTFITGSAYYQGNIHIVSTSSNAVYGNGTSYLKSLASGTYTINYDNGAPTKFFANIGTDAMFTIPATGYYTISWNNNAFFLGVSPNSSAYNFNWTATLRIDTYSEAKSGHQVGFITGSLCYWTVTSVRRYFTAGQKIIISCAWTQTAVGGGTVPDWTALGGTINISSD